MLAIGIAGGTGCGKTTVVNQIIGEFPSNEVGILSQDAYYQDLSHLSYKERCEVNFDHPRAIDFDLMATHLKELRKGMPIEQPVYSFVDHNRTRQTTQVYPRKVMIIEGILILTQPEIRDLFDIKIYVHADSDERLIRRLRRDMGERGRALPDVLDRYQHTLKPMHERFIEPTKEFADIIIPNNRYNDVAVEILRTIISEKLTSV